MSDVDFPPPPRAPDLRSDPNGNRNWRDFDRWIFQFHEYIARLVTRLVTAGSDVVSAADRLNAIETDVSALQASNAVKVTGSGAASNNKIARWEGVTGFDIKEAPVTIDDDGAMAEITTIEMTPGAVAPTLTVNGTFTWRLTSDTNLRFYYRGSDGTTRVADVTLA